ncbi:MAG TPA: branched-chain amino acid ABC transporter permease [Syntrophomonas sp.]|nr:branched-chain amino acid ABC transporter permease [Syntrophomonas sp.]HPT69394.1 branched-chain amino acid ABC transporter permease [Syntrophomonas sp.]
MLSRRDKRLTIIGIVVLGIVLFILNQVMADYYLRIINLIGINIILVASLNLTNGFTGIFSMGHAGFMAVGAYTSALLTIPITQKAALLPDLPLWLANLHVPFVAGLLAAGLMSMLFALLIGYPVLRLRGHYLAVATLGFLVIVRVVLTNIESITRGARGISGLPGVTNSWWIYGTLVIVMYCLWRFIHSSYGRGIMSIRDDDIAAQALGINITTHKMMAFCIGAFFAGVGGALWGDQMSVISPNFFSFNQTFTLVEMSVIGGMGSMTGAVVGAAVMTIIPELLRNLEVGITIMGMTLPPLYGLSQLILAALVVIVIIFRPQGIMGRWEFSWQHFAREKKKLRLQRQSSSEQEK